jgi:AraC-like DNA-binding protein
MQPRQYKTVSAIAVVDLANEFIQRGVINENDHNVISPLLCQLLAESRQGKTIVEKRLPESDLVSLWEMADQRVNNSSIGLAIGTKVNVNAKGLLANWLSTCESLNQAFNLFKDNIMLLNCSEIWESQTQEQVVKLIFQFKSDFDYPVMAIERSMSALISWAEYLSGKKVNIRQASFIYSKPRYASDYFNVFGKSLIFNAEINSLELNSADFNLAIKDANPFLRELIERRLDDIRLEIESSNSIKIKVQQCLKSNLKKYCKLEAHINALHLSKASLYRKLKQEGAIFSDLVVQERKSRLAKKTYSNYESAKLSEELGFRDISSFYKFLKKHG